MGKKRKRKSERKKEDERKQTNNFKKTKLPSALCHILSTLPKFQIKFSIWTKKGTNPLIGH